MVIDRRSKPAMLVKCCIKFNFSASVDVGGGGGRNNTWRWSIMDADESERCSQCMRDRRRDSEVVLDSL